MSERARLWQRVSTGGQDEASQLPDLIKHCDAHGYEYDLAESYVIHGKSAWHGKHQGTLDRAFADMTAGEYSVLVVWKQDRIERRGMEAALNLVSRAKQAGGRIEFVTQPHLNRLNDMGGRISYVIMAEVAEQESQTKSDRIKIKHDALRASGSVVGRPPWGYRIVQRDGVKVLEPTEEGRKYIPLIFQSVIDGKSLRSIAAWLDSEGVTTVEGKRWNEGYLGNRLVKNTTYKGKRPNGGQLETEELVSPTTWDEANAALASRVRPGRATVKHAKPLVSPYCAACWDEVRDGCPSGKSPMYRVFSQYGDGKRAMFRCWGHGPQRKGCGARMLPVDEVEAAVFDAMRHNDRPHFDHEFIPGDSRSDEISRLREDGAAAMRKGDYQAAMAAMQEAERLEALPRVAPHWEKRDTGMTEAQYFATLDADGQRDYLQRMQVLVMANDDVILAVVTERGMAL